MARCWRRSGRACGSSRISRQRPKRYSRRCAPSSTGHDDEQAAFALAYARACGGEAFLLQKRDAFGDKVSRVKGDARVKGERDPGDKVTG